MVHLLRVLAQVVCGLTLAPPGYCLCHGFEHSEPASDSPAHDDDHAPGCPAAAGGKQLRAEPTADIGVTPVITAFVPAVISPVTGETGPPVRPLVRRAHAPPLYLSHCALVL